MFNTLADLQNAVMPWAELGDGKVTLRDVKAFRRQQTDDLITNAVFNPDARVKELCRQLIKETALKLGIVSSSIQPLYEAAGRGEYQRKTVPAMNIRGITYHVARRVFRAAMKQRVGAFVFEIARSEIGYTEQRPAEYAVCVLAAAIREGFFGPVFIQGDHFQFNAKKYSSEPEAETNSLKDLVREAIAADFLNIDIDASTLVDISLPTLEKQQEKNYRVTAEMTRFIRTLQPKGVTISVGGEIGEVGKANSTVEDLAAFMDGYKKVVGGSVKGISKISVQTGTKHGGLVMPDGSVAKVKVDFETLGKLSQAARERYGMAGAVQHGASTLPDDAFDHFPRVGTAEIHLATGFQNIIYQSPRFPKDLLTRIDEYLREAHGKERKPSDTEEQFIYENRKRAFGPFKKDLWELPEDAMNDIMGTLEDRFGLLFSKLNIQDTVDLVKKYAKP
ncbi:MAG: class II fructose-bisphosphate aldolase [Dehalococcoidia bacterium]|nr:class II fructose-bisphosphate aldolase [Dehalococcoidia bacterium]